MKGFPISQGSLGALPDFVQDKVVKGNCGIIERG